MTFTRVLSLISSGHVINVQLGTICYSGDSCVQFQSGAIMHYLKGMVISFSGAENIK